MLSLRVDSATSYPARHWQVPRLQRDQRWLAGVAAAIATEIGVDPLLIRLSLVLLTLSGGIGLALYAAAWLWFTYHARSHPEQPYAPVAKGQNPRRRALGVSAVVMGLILAAERTLAVGVADAAVWPVAVSVFGILIVWSSGKVDWSAPSELLRAVAGLLLVSVGVVAFVVSNVGLSRAPRALVISTAIVLLVILIVAPWLWRAASQVSEERQKRIRADERAQLAAHLHDSVLQTLSLIVQSADDRNTTVNLARRQERELRQWLFGRAPSPSGERHFRAALSSLAAQVEQLHGLPVEVVVVGDGDVDDTVQAALAATRELMLNAAKHSGAARVDVYGELGPERLEVFVRDTGRGFDPASVPEDRRGLADSVVGRIERIGGRVNITSSGSVSSATGRGTEVSISVPLGVQP